MELQQQQPTESISQDSRDELKEEVVSKSSKSDSVVHDVSSVKNINPMIIVSAIPVELIGKMDLRRCKSPPDELAPCLNSRTLLRLVPEPKGPDCKTESPLSDKTIETIRLHVRKECGAPPGETDFHSLASVAQAELAVGPFKDHPKRQTKKDKSASKKSQAFPMQSAHNKENKKQRSLVPVLVDEVSDSEDDILPDDAPIPMKQPAVKRLPFSNSPVKRNELVVTQGKGRIRKPCYNPIANQKPWCIPTGIFR